MKRLLTLKHWQLFGILVGLPFIFQIIIIASFALKNNFSIMMLIMPLIMIVCMSVFFAWFYSLGTNLHKKLASNTPMEIKKFKWFMFYPIVYIIIVTILMFTLMLTMINGESEPTFFLVIIPFHLFAMFCMFYCLNFNAKVLKTVELKRNITFSEYAGEFFLLWFFPLGIWILQPRINKIFETDKKEVIN